MENSYRSVGPLDIGPFDYRYTYCSVPISVPIGSAGAYSGISSNPMYAAPPSTKERFAKGVKRIKYKRGMNVYVVERANRFRVDLFHADIIPSISGYEPMYGFFMNSPPSIRDTELGRLSGPYDIEHDVDLAWNEIVWNLFHDGCDSIEDVVFSEDTNWETWTTKNQMEEQWSDEPSEELMSFLDSITNETEGEADG